MYLPTSHLLTEFPEDIKNLLILRDGAWYAYPSHLSSEDAAEIWKPCDTYYTDYLKYLDNNAIIWNGELLEELGIKVETLQTEEAVWEAFKRVMEWNGKTDGEEILPLLIDGANYRESTLKFLQYTFGAEYIDEEGNFKDIVLQEETQHALWFLNEAFRKGVLDAEQLTMTNDEIKRKIRSEKVLCFIGNIANLSLEGENWVSSGVILSSEGENPVFPVFQEFNTGWMQTYVSKDCKDPQTVAEFLDYMTGEEGMKLWYFGFEGIDYSQNEDGTVTLSEEQEKKKADYHENGIDAWWMFENRSWVQSIKRVQENESKQEEELKTAFGKDSHTVVYSGAALQAQKNLLSETSGISEQEKKIEEWKRKRIPQIILAESVIEFFNAYDRMITKLYQSGIAEIDREKNEVFWENQKFMNVTLKKINL